MPASSSEVIYVKEGEAKNFVIVDAAMNDLIRPTLYDAFTRSARWFRPLPTARASSPMSSARSARPATFWRTTATCRARRPAT
jgi:diaminopimelate decarboxylase